MKTVSKKLLKLLKPTRKYWMTSKKVQNATITTKKPLKTADKNYHKVFFWQ